MEMAPPAPAVNRHKHVSDFKLRHYRSPRRWSADRMRRSRPHSARWR